MKRWYKICSHCWKEIKEDAIKCQHCFEFLNWENKIKDKKWNYSMYICFWIIIIIIAVVFFFLWRLWNKEQYVSQSDSQTNSSNDIKQKNNFDRDMECQKYVHICEEKRQSNIDANYYTTNWNKPIIWIFYSPLEDTCLCYYDTEITNYEWVYWEWKYHYSAVITDAFKEWEDPTRKTAVFEDTPSNWEGCKWYSAYQWMTYENMVECSYPNSKSSFLEEVARLKWN